ncbi:MAG: hypothetical protein FWH05_07070 [Oscillospiraceae bacterium]|nr:hypothetical protein [Oscillospiraceae bacterium]
MRAKNVPIIEMKNSKAPESVFLNTLVRFALLWLAALGTCLVFADTYEIAVDFLQTAVFCFICVFGMCGFFVLLKRRFALPVLVGTGWLLWRVFSERTILAFEHFLNHFAYRLDSRLLYTSVYASLRESRIDMELVLTATFILFFLICFLYSLHGRDKYVGAILIVVIVLLVPAFIAESAFFSGGFYLLAAAMAGLYVTWIQHEMTPGVNKEKKKSHVFGGAPYINSHGIQGITAALVCSLCLGTAVFAVGDENSSVNRLIYDLQQKLIYAFENLPELFSPVGNVNHSGYFSFSSANEISSYVHLNAPTPSDRPVLTVRKSDNTEPLYLRGGICLDYNSGARGWSTSNRTESLKQLNELIERYYPETEYMLFAQRFRVGAPLGDSLAYYEVIDNQDVYIDYLLNTRVVLTPPSVIYPDYKKNESIQYSLDTVLRAKTPMESDSFSTFYLKSSDDFGFALERLNEIITNERADSDDRSLITEFPGFIAVTSLEQLNMRASEYLDNKRNYERLIREVYSGVPDTERANIERLKQEIGIPMRNVYNYANDVAEYFRTYYGYSLVTDNLLGDNTMLGNFLFETRTGHCALYATAMTLLLRNEGVTARYVTGYAVRGIGTPVQDNLFQYTVLERDLHAWVEVYFENLGWVAFDPTPAITESVFVEAQFGANATPPPLTTESATQTTPPQEESNQPTETTAPAQTHSDNNETQGRTTQGNNNIATIILIALAIAIVIGASLFIVAVFRKESAFFKGLKRTPPDLNAAASKATELIALLWKTESLTPNTAELPLEFAARVDGKLEFTTGPTAEKAVEIIEKSEFSKEPITQEEYRILTQYLTQLYERTVLSQKPVKRMLRRVGVMNN